MYCKDCGYCVPGDATESCPRCGRDIKTLPVGKTPGKVLLFRPRQTLGPVDRRSGSAPEPVVPQDVVEPVESEPRN